MSKPLGILRHHFFAQIVTDVVFLYFPPIVERQRLGKDVKSHKATAHHSIKNAICVCLFVRQQGK